MKKCSVIHHFLILIFLIVNQSPIFASDWISKLNKTIKNNGQNWKAGESWVTRLSPEERKKLLGEILEIPADAEARLIRLPKVKSLPSHFDWRENEGNWVTPVRNQDTCGSCWAFSTTAQVESWWKIANNDIDTTIDLSEQFLISCSDAGDCDGGYSSRALEWYKNVGVPSESCFVYTAANDTCENACPDWQDEVTKIPGWGYITLDEDIIDNIKAAIFRHPVSASFVVYRSFQAYDSGIYEYTPDPDEEPEGGHAILIIGWDDMERYWICKNSWRADWGENGYFRIKWHNCEIGRFMPFIYSVMIGAALTVSPAHLEFSLPSGDSSQATITLNNESTSTLEFSAIDFLVQYAWHPDTMNAYDGKSWWCAKPEIAGYENGWLQYLETPIIDLHSTTSPSLTWMGNWSVESPVGAETPYDGWDGCNVWVSTDGGKNFNVAIPNSPAYNCQSLWSFGDAEQGWNMGPEIPGWGGSSGRWISVDFDLTSYISDSVVIRWAFASDMGYCSIDDPSLTGFLVDNIIINDGDNTLFENYGEDINSMILGGYSGYNPASWLDINNGGGIILPNSSTDILVKINTKNMKPGKYHANIKFTTNDTTQSAPVIPCYLDVLASVTSIVTSAVPYEWKLDQNYPNPFNPNTTINYALPQNCFVKIAVYDISGREIKVIKNEFDNAGYKSVIWNGTDNSEFKVPSGVYIYSIEAKDYRATRKMLLIK